MAKLIGVPAIAVPSVWPDIAPMIEHCLDKSREHRFSLGDIYSMLAGSDLQAWVVTEGKGVKTIVLTQVIVYPQAKECVVFMAVGEYPENWREITDGLVTWAQSIGCTHASAYMRRGLLKRMGWDERQTYCVRALE